MHIKPHKLVGPFAAAPAPQGVSPARPVFARVGNAGEISITGGIGDWVDEYSLAQFQSDFSALLAQGVSSINLNLNTPGGSVSDAFGMYDIIKAANVPVHAYINGLCASAGTIVASAAQDITIAPRSQWMVHEPTGGAFGTLAECQMALDYFAKLRDSLIDIYRARTGLPAADIVEQMNPGSFLSAQQALAGHWVDAIGVNPLHAGDDGAASGEGDGEDEDAAEDAPSESPASPEEDDPKKAPAAAECDPEEEESPEKPAARSSRTAPRGFFASVKSLGHRVSQLFTPAAHPTAEQLLEQTRKENKALAASLDAMQRQNSLLQQRLESRAAQQGAQFAAAALTTSGKTPRPADPPVQARRSVTREEIREAARSIFH